MESEYLIWSAEHQAWWGPGRCGYSKGLLGAGKYSRDAAIEICREAIPTSGHLGHCSEVPVRFEDVRAFTSEQLIPAPFMRGRR